MKINECKVGMKIIHAYKPKNVGTITGIGKKYVLAVFPDTVLGEIELHIDPIFYIEAKEDKKPSHYTITIECRDDETVYGVFLKDGIVFSSATIVLDEESNLNDGMNDCLTCLLKYFNN